MAQRGRRSAADQARRSIKASAAFESEFEELSQGMQAWLDHGNYDAFMDALHALEDRYFEELPPVDPGASRDERLADFARRYAVGVTARSRLQLMQQLVAGKIEDAHAQLIATSAQPTEMSSHWRKFVTGLRAAGIRQEDIHPVSRALCQHVAASIREFLADGGAQADETYSDAPIGSWAELPREFAGFRLIDIDPDDSILAMKRLVHPLPPSTDIAHYAVNRAAPPTLHNREATYRSWIKIIEAWADRTGRELNDQQPAIWAMLLAHRMVRDNSKVAFFHRQLIESPWRRAGVVMIEVVEGDLPPEYS